MVFTSTVFLVVFLPITLLLYFLLPERFRNLFLMLISLFFYAWGEVYYVGVLLLSMGLNYTLTCAMAQTPVGKKRKRYVITGIILNLGILGFFKYANFFVDNINTILTTFGLPVIQMASVHLPIGISFFTFQTMSYVIDVYAGRVEAQKKFVDLGLYISLFPVILSGPIIRYKDIAAEISQRNITVEGFSYGIRRFIIGMGKKMILANSLAEVADMLFALGPGELSTPYSWLGVLCYTLQIYFDFSGYSDMAIGLGRMFGFTFLENFNYPYISASIREFWRRWHISLSTWFRDYLYIPLGGNRCSQLRTQMNLLIVFVLCGLWHGASWNFVIWGGMHGFFMALERGRVGRFLERAWRPFQHLYAVLVVMIGWVFFRADTLSGAVQYLSVMFGFESGTVPVNTLLNLLPSDKQVVLAFAILASLPWRSIFEAVKDRILPVSGSPASGIFMKHRSWAGVGAQTIQLFLLLSIFVVSLMYIAAGTYNPFIYFRF